MEQKKQIGKKSSKLDSGYIWAPYIPTTKNPKIIDGLSRTIIRKRKINKIFDLGLEASKSFFKIFSCSDKKSLSHFCDRYYMI